MKVSVFGLGYVGTVSAACLAGDGHDVIGVDVNPSKVETINSGNSPVVEPGLGELVGQVVTSGRLRAVADGRTAVRESEVCLICVGTPSKDNGSLQLDHVENVCREIGKALAADDAYRVIVVRSTVLPGTVRERLIPVLEESSGKRAGAAFGVCMNPEFLREGSTVDDYYQPSQIVIGELDDRSGRIVEDIYRSVDACCVHATIETAEMVKYVNNAFHALKVVFANEIGSLCKVHHVDGQEVMNIFCQDRRLNISTAYLKPGFAFGGSCLPKDLRALMYDAKTNDVECPVLGQVLVSNERQVQRGIELIERTGRKRIGVLGLSFKAHTDDVRESPMVPMIETLIGRGFTVCVYDDIVDPARLIGSNKAYLERELPHIASVMRQSLDEVIAEAEVLVLANGSPTFREVPTRVQPHQIVVDLVGIAKNHQYELNGKYQSLSW